MLSPDTVLQSRYRIVRQLNAGGMGIVYEAIDIRFNSQVALKETHFTEEALRKQFEREAHLLYKLRHPAIARVIDHFEEGDGLFLVMDYIEGEDLWQMLEKRRAPFPVDEVLEWANQLLDALAYLHSQDPPVIHRDIKPQNLKLTTRNQIILLDFGLAKGFAGQISRVTTSGSIFGFTPTYASMEQIQGTGTDARSDLYSLGATLYHLLTNSIPVDVLSRASARVAEQPDPLRPVNEMNPDVSVELAAVLKKAMELISSKRFGNATEMQAALDKASSAQGQSSNMAATYLPEESTRPVKSVPSSKRRPLILVLLLVLLVSIAALIFIISRRYVKTDSQVPNGVADTQQQTDSSLGVWALKATLTGHTEEVVAVAFSPDDKTIASGSVDRTVKLWDAETGTLKRTITGHSNSVSSVAFARDGKTLFSGSSDGTIYLWNVQSAALENKLKGHRGDIVALAISLDGKTLVSGSSDKTIKIWDAQTGALKLTLTGHKSRISDVAFSPDNQTIASSSDDKTVKTWDAQTGALKLTLTGHSDAVYSVEFSPDNKTLASSSKDKTIRIWSSESGALARVVSGSYGQIGNIAFSPDGRLLAGVSSDKTIKLWDGRTGEFKQSLSGHSGEVWDVAFSGDGKTLASGGDDKTVKIWKLQPSQ
jgi:WD40 repeat protein/predicted Ser/Thr protein kinase